MSIASSTHSLAAIEIPAALPTEPVMRFSVEQYHEMIRVGILQDGDPVELLEGWLVTKMNKNPPHVIALALVAKAIDRLLPSGWHVKTQDPVTTESSEPEPDVSIVRGDVRDYFDRHPGPADSAIVVEVADSSLSRDRGIKRRIYARAAVPVYWIVNLVDRQIEVYSDPSGPAEKPEYRQEKIFAATDEVPVLLGQQELGRLRVADLLP